MTNKRRFQDILQRINTLYREGKVSDEVAELVDEMCNIVVDMIKAVQGARQLLGMAFEKGRMKKGEDEQPSDDENEPVDYPFDQPIGAIKWRRKGK